MPLRCEKMAKKIPALRAAMAKEMVSQGMPQEQVAKLLGVSQGAISQYINRQRGRDLFVAALQPQIKEICQRLQREHSDLEKEICNLCRNL